MYKCITNTCYETFNHVDATIILIHFMGCWLFGYRGMIPQKKSSPIRFVRSGSEAWSCTGADELNRGCRGGFEKRMNPNLKSVLGSIKLSTGSIYNHFMRFHIYTISFESFKKWSFYISGLFMMNRPKSRNGKKNVSFTNLKINKLMIGPKKDNHPDDITYYCCSKLYNDIVLFPDLGTSTSWSLFWFPGKCQIIPCCWDTVLVVGQAKGYEAYWSLREQSSWVM